MTVKVRRYTDKPGFTEDFKKVRDFLIRINRDSVVTAHFLWGRWEWAFSLPYLDTSNLSRIGIWEEDGAVVALVTYEQSLGYAYICIDPRYYYLKKETLIYAKDNLSKDGKLLVLINDADRESQIIASELGFVPTQHKEPNSIIDIDQQRLSYILPDGFSITSLSDEYDLYKYNSVLWKGFNHEGEPPVTPEQLEDRRISLSGPDVKLNLNIAVVAPNGEFVSYCGMWYEQGDEYALVEPVATHPDYRRLGLGKAAVLEAVKRCGQLGAKTAYVGSSQLFYYNIGFSPIPGDTFWEINS